MAKHNVKIDQFPEEISGGASTIEEAAETVAQQAEEQEAKNAEETIQAEKAEQAESEEAAAEPLVVDEAPILKTDDAVEIDVEKIKESQSSPEPSAESNDQKKVQENA